MAMSDPTALDEARARVRAGRTLVAARFPASGRPERPSDPVELLADLAVALADLLTLQDEAMRDRPTDIVPDGKW